MSVVDVLNEIGNNFAVSSDGIATALQDSASSLMAAGNDLNQSVALVAAANKVVQDPNSVGSALRTISLRIRGTSVKELEALGEETDNVVESTSKLQSKVKALSGVDILTDSGAYKSTYEILKEIAHVWEDMSDIDQAALLELLAGKNRSNTLAAILGNVEDLEGAYESALDAEGSAMAENEKQLNSIQGRITLFNNAVQTMWKNTLNSDAVKFFVKLGTSIVKVTDKVGLLKAAIAALATYKFGKYFIKQNLELTKQGASASDIWKKERESAFGLKNLTKKVSPEVAQDDAKVVAAKQAAAADNEKVTAAHNAANADNAKATAAQNFIDSMNNKTSQDASENIETDAAERVAQAKEKEINAAERAAQAQEEEANAAKRAAEADNAKVGAADNAAQADNAESVASRQSEQADNAEAVASRQSEQADIAEANASRQAEQADVAEAAASRQASSADSSQAGSSIGSSIAGSSAAGAALGGLKGLALGLLLSLAAAGIQKLIGWVDDLIHRQEILQEEVKDLTNTYKTSVDEINSSLSKLTISNDSDKFKTLEDEFVSLSAGVDAFGNNIGLTSEQYERYKSICETIVGVNNKLIEGHNSATEAIGNNANALSALIEFQKEQARLQAEEYVNSENLPKIAENAKNDYDDAHSGGLTFPTPPVVSPPTDNTFTGWAKWLEDNPIPHDEFGAREWLEEQRAAWVEDYEDWYNNLLKDNDIAADTPIMELPDDLKKQATDKLNYFASQYQSLILQVNRYIEELDAEELNGMRTAMSAVLTAMKGYSDAPQSVHKFMSDWVNESSDFMITGSFDPDKDPEKWKKQIQDFYQNLIDSANDPSTWQSLSFEGDSKFSAQQLLDKIYNFDPSSVSWEQYQEQMQELIAAFWKAMGVDDPTAEQRNFFGGIDVDFSTKNDDVTKWINVLSERLDVDADIIQERINSMPANKVEAFLQIDWDAVAPNSWQEVEAAINKQIPAAREVVGNTLSTYADTLEKFTNVQSIQNEVIYDNIELTEDQGAALKELIGGEEDYADAVDESNGYVVKNIELVNRLIAKKKQEAVQNAKTEKSQARLKYYELYKKIRQLTGANGELAQANAKEINALYKEMGAVEQTIAKYSMLEQRLLGAANAYDKFEEAQTADQAKDYGSKAEEMISSLIEGLQSAKIGTETFRAAVLGMIPEEVYSNLDTVEEKVAAIANYLKNSDFSKYFTLTFGDDGTLESAEMKLDNVKAFIESAQEKGVFTNKGDWTHFELSDDIKTLDDFCEKMNLTKEMAFAMFTEIDSYDGEWLNGDFGTMLDQLDLGLEGNIFMATKTLTELDVSLANNKISVEEWAEKYQEANFKLQGCAQEARTNAVEYQNATTEVANYKKELEQATQKLSELNKPESGATQEKIQAQTDKVKQLTEQLGAALQKKYGLEEPTEMSIQLALDDIDSQMTVWKANNNELAVKANIANIDDSQLVELGEDGKYQIKPDVEITDDERQKLQQYIDLLNDQGTINLLVENQEEAKAQIEEVKTAAEAAKKAIEALPDPSVDSTAAVKSINNLIDAIDRVPTGVTVTTTYREVNENQTATKHSGRRSRYELNSTMANGTAHASGNWGLPQAEDDALVGELGRETVVDPKTGKYYTVGDNGAEFVDLPKNAIIFNHKQTEELFKNGHINSRGKAYSEGNAHVTIVPDYTTPTYYSGAKNDNFWTDWNDAADSLSDAGDDLSDAANDFEEMFDWFAVLLEEIDDDLNYMSAALENAVGISAKNDIQEQMINVNKFKLTELGEGYKLYADYAAELLGKVPEQYRDLAEKGGVALTEFLGEANQEVVEAINNYREWAQKASDVRTQQQQVKKEITSLSLQKVQTIADEYDRVITKITTLNDLLQANVDLIDEQGERTSAVMYEEMIKNSIKELDELQKKRNDMQKEFDAQVSAGNIDVGSEEWYEGVSAIQDVDKAIIDCRKEIEGFQNSINQLHWDNFDGLIKAIDNVGNEISNLGDLIDDEDIADEMGNWTNEGITKMGLLAQEMERAQYRAKQYAEQIEYLNQEYAAGKYSTDEYNEKLQELKDGQWDSIKSYEAAKDALIALNKTRVDAAKNAMQEEIDAYNELINKKKEELQLSKDAHDFSKQVEEQQKNIANIQKQLAAIAGDNSASAIARRKKLEAELAAAQEELDELYYSHSIEKQQDALDDQAENYQDEKEKEMEALDEYLKNVEQVIADSFATITGNTEVVAGTLKEIADEYGINLSEAITNPWEQGVIAIGTYQDQLNTSTSAFTAQLEAIKKQLLDLQAAADETARHLIDATNQNANKTSSATYTTPTPSTPQQPSTPQKPAAPANGSSVTVKKSATHFTRDGGNGTRMQSWVPGSTFTVYQVSGSEVLIGRNGKYTGWIKLSDIEGYAKGIKQVPNDQFAITDELGLEELVLHAGANGKLQYLSKGSSVIPSDITDNLMKLGALDPKDILDRNKPKIGAPYIINNSIELNMSFGNMINIEHADRDSIPDIKDAVKAQLDSYMKGVNNSLKRFTR